MTIDGVRPARGRRSAPAGPRGAAPRSSLARHVASDFARLRAQLEGAARRVRREHDREAAHDLRVATRRLASALDVWGGLLDDHATQRARRRLRSLRRSAGLLRDTEVARELLVRLAGSLSHLPRLAVEDLARRVELRIARRAGPAARDSRRARIRRALRDVERALEPLAHPIGTAAARAHADAQVDALERNARSAVGAALRSRDDDDALHAARIAVKRWRYGVERLQILDRPSGPAAARHATAVAEARAIQRGLGLLHDLAGARDLITRRIGRLLERERRAEAEALQEALPTIVREREAPLLELQRLVTTRSGTARLRVV